MEQTTSSLPGARVLIENTQPGRRRHSYVVATLVRETAKQIVVSYERAGEPLELRFWKETMREVGGEASRPSGLASMTHVVSKLILPTDPEWNRSVVEHNGNLRRGRAERAVAAWKQDDENPEKALLAAEALTKLAAVLRSEQRGADQ